MQFKNGLGRNRLRRLVGWDDLLLIDLLWQEMGRFWIPHWRLLHMQ